MTDPTSITLGHEVLSLDEAGRRAASLGRQIGSARAESKRRTIELGQLLAGVRERVAHGQYEAWLETWGINKHTARLAVKFASLADGRGNLDEGRVREIRDRRVRAGEIPATAPVVGVPVSDLRRADIERVVGFRPLPPAWLAEADAEPAAEPTVEPAEPCAVEGSKVDTCQLLETAGGIHHRGTESTERAPSRELASDADRAGHRSPVTGHQMTLAQHVASVIDELEAECRVAIGRGVGLAELAGRLRRLADLIEGVELKGTDAKGAA